MLKDVIIWTQRKDVKKVAKTKTGRKTSHIPIIDPEKYGQFFTELKDSTELELEYKAFLGMLVCSGMRVEEGLSIRLKDYNKVTGTIVYKLSKKHDVVIDKKTGEKTEYAAKYRTFRLNKTVKLLFDTYLATLPLRNFTYLFSFSRQTVNYRLIAIFGKGAGPHTIARHSYITYLIQKRKMTKEQLIGHMDVSINTWEYYAHSNQEAESKDIQDAVDAENDKIVA